MTDFKFSMPVQFASEETSEVGDSMLVTYKDAVIAIGGPTEPESYYDYENGKESVRRLDLTAAIEAKAVFAPRLKQPEGIPVYVGHDTSLSLGRVTDIRFGKFNDRPALLADIELMESSPDPRMNHVLEGISQKIGIGLSMGLDPSTIKVSETKEKDGSSLVSFTEFGIREVSLTPEPRIPGAHLFSLSSSHLRNNVMTNSIQTAAPQATSNEEEILERIDIVARQSQGPSSKELANDRVFSYLANTRTAFEGQTDTVNQLFALGEQYRSGSINETQVYSQATSIAQRSGNVESLARDGSSPQTEARHMATRIVESVPTFSLANLLEAGMRRRSDPSFSNDEFEVMNNLQREFPNMAGANPPSGKGTHIPMPTQALMTLVSERQGVNFGQTYGTSTINGQTGSDQIDESRSPDYARNLLARFLRPSNVAMGLGVTTVPVTRDIVVPIQTSGTSAGWLGENASAPAQSYDVDTQASSPRRIAAQGNFSWQLEAGEGTGAGSLGSYMLLIDDLNRGVNQQKELALFGGTGNNGQPTGVVRTTGINAVTVTATPTWATIASFLTPILTNNIDANTAAWVTTPRWYQVLRTTLQSASANSIFLTGSAAMEQGRARAMMDGFPLYVTNNLPRIGSGNNEDVLMLGVFSELLDIQYARSFITIDDTSNAANAFTTVTYNGFCFVIARRPKAFSVGSVVFA